MTLAEEARTAFEQRSHQYKYASVSMALAREAAGTRFLRGSVAFHRNQPLIEERLDYGPLILERKQLQPSDGWAFVEELAAGRTPKGFDFVIPPSPTASTPTTAFTWDQFRTAARPDLPTPFGYARLFDWPALVYLLRPSSPANPLPPAPLVKEGLPVIVDLQGQVDRWFGWVAQNFMLYNGFMLLLPDYRARIQRVRFEPRGVMIQTESDLLTDTDLAVRAVVDTEEPAVEAGRDKGSFWIPAEQLPEHFYFFLMDRQRDGVVDWAEVHTSWPQVPEGVEYALPEARIERFMELGESNAIEFKQELSNGFAFLQSVVAFANTQGGTILVGVDDNGREIGTDPGVDASRISNWIDARCDPPVYVSTEAISVREKKILVVSVPPGNNPPYTLRDNGIAYVRRGATDRPARRAELDAIYARREEQAKAARGPWYA